MSKLSHLNDAHAAWSADPSDANLENLLQALTRLAETIVSRYPLEDRENAASAAVFRLWGTLDRFKGRSSFSTWSYAVISNAYRDDLRKQTRRKKTFEEYKNQYFIDNSAFLEQDDGEDV